MSINSKVWKIIGWAGAALVVFGYYLNANELSISWLIWIAGNIMAVSYTHLTLPTKA